MLASIAEFETQIRRERQLEGIEKAKEKGVQFGRRAKFTNDQLDQMKRERAQGTKIKDLMEKYAASKSTIYRLLAQ